MKNQKYYCAWHPEEMEMRLIRSVDSDGSEITRQDAIDIITRAYIEGTGILSQGWQVKEVVIVDAYDEKKYGCIDDYLKECFPEIYKLL